MARARVFMPENRLATVIGGYGDPSVEVLATRAQARLAEVHDQVAAYVTESSETLIELASRGEDEVRADIQRIGDLALGVCEVAGVVGLRDIGEAMRGIRAMTEAYANIGFWRTDALRLHVGALSLLMREPRPGAAAAREALARLRQMRERLGIEE